MIRMTPSGRSRSDARSATETGRWQLRSILLCSGSRPDGSGVSRELAETSATRSKLCPAGRVRPPVSAYGRTTGPASSSSHWSAEEGMAYHAGSLPAPAGPNPDGTGLDRTARCAPTRLTSTAIS
jgi:hypothetical protein